MSRAAAGPWLTALVIGVAIPAVAPAAPLPGAARSVAEMARYYRNAGRFEEAARSWHEAHRLDPLPAYLQAAARCEELAGDLRAAVSSTRRALQLPGLDRRARKRLQTRLADLERRAPPEPDPPPKPAPKPEPAPAPPRKTGPKAGITAGPVPARRPAPKAAAHPWWHAPVGWTAATLGAVGLTGGTGLYYTRNGPIATAGAVTAVGGLGLTVLAAILLSVDHPDHELSVALSPRSGRPGLSAAVRF